MSFGGVARKSPFPPSLTRSPVLNGIETLSSGTVTGGLGCPRKPSGAAIKGGQPGVSSTTGSVIDEVRPLSGANRDQSITPANLSRVQDGEDPLREKSKAADGQATNELIAWE